MAAEFDRFIREAQRQRGNFFDRERPLTVARAPTWVDLIGGALPVGGPLALGWPLGASSFVALQPDPKAHLTLWDGQGPPAILPLSILARDDGWPREYAEIAAALAGRPALLRLAAAAWAALCREEFARFPGGARMYIRPTDGPGWQVAVSAVVAQALVSAFGVRLAPRELGLTVRMGMSSVAGADPGYLGALVSVCAQAGAVLPVHQQPAWLWGGVHLPAQSTLYALCLGEAAPDVGAADPWRGAAARRGDPELPASTPASQVERAAVATTMAYRVVAEALALPFAEAHARWRGYLANLGTPSFAGVRKQLPERLAGEDFLHRFGSLSGVELRPELAYPLGAAAALAIEEHVRARTALALLRAAGIRGDHGEELSLVGELMLQSHLAQNAVGLGNVHADQLVERIYAAGPALGLYGARAPAAASGAALVVLGTVEAASELRSIVDRYAAETGLPVTVFGGSASGCNPAGTREI